MVRTMGVIISGLLLASATLVVSAAQRATPDSGMPGLARGEQRRSGGAVAHTSGVRAGLPLQAWQDVVLSSQDSVSKQGAVQGLVASAEDVGEVGLCLANWDQADGSTELELAQRQDPYEQARKACEARNAGTLECLLIMACRVS